MNKLVRQHSILRHTTVPVVFYLRKTRNITRFCKEIRNAEKTTDSPKFNLNSFDWNNSIYGFEFWSNLKHSYKIWKKSLNIKEK